MHRKINLFVSTIKKTEIPSTPMRSAKENTDEDTSPK
jgi:hypothetical protein